MREVAAASGIRPGSLYHHFASKEAIAVELVEEYHSDLTQVVREFRQDELGPLAALLAFVRAVADVSFRHQAALQISVFDAPATASSSLKTVVHAEPASLDRRWRSLISAASAAGEIKPAVDTRILRHVLHRTISQVTLAWNSPSGPDPVVDCVTALVFDGLTTAGPECQDNAKPARAVDDVTSRWTEQAAQRRQQRRGVVLDAARAEFAQRGFEATTMRDIADAAGLKASNLYRYFDSKDALIEEILGDFSDELLAAFRDVVRIGSSTVETLDAILWLLTQASRHFSQEVEILQTWNRLLALGVGGRYHKGAQARLTLLVDLIQRGVADGELVVIAEPTLVASCLREIIWAPMPDMMHISVQRVREFHRQSVLSGIAVRQAK